jgi:hypothetical protein
MALRRHWGLRLGDSKCRVPGAVVSPMYLLLAILAVSCGSGSSSSSPSPSPTVPTSPPPTTTSPPTSPVPTAPANVAGNWIGTLESSGLASRSISVLAFQSGTCVDGAWKTDPPEWVGAISGFADVGSFSGSLSFERPADGPGKCAGIATFSGEVGTDTIRWTSTGFTGTCAGGLPQSLTLTLRRE